MMINIFTFFLNVCYESKNISQNIPQGTKWANKYKGL